MLCRDCMSEYDRMSNDELKCHAALLALEPGTFEDRVRQRWRDMYCKASDLMKTGLPPRSKALQR